MNFKGTKSQQNILAAFHGESAARNKYTYFAAQALKEGHIDIAHFFEKMADNEKEHAKIWFKLLHDGFKDTMHNLQEAANDENYEWRTMYPEFAAQARADGLEMLAIMFEKIASIENDHEKRFLETYLNFVRASSPKAIEKEVPAAPTHTIVKYRCIFCGNIEEARLDVCPVCEAIGPFEQFRTKA